MKELKKIQMELNLVIILLAQLNRQYTETVNGEPKRPTCAMIRESGNVESDSDTVLLLHRPYIVKPDGYYPDEVELIVAKNRQNSGVGGIILMKHNKTTSRFEELADLRKEPEEIVEARRLEQFNETNRRMGEGMDEDTERMAAEWAANHHDFFDKAFVA